MKKLKCVSILVLSMTLLIGSCSEKEPLSPNANEKAGIESGRFLKSTNSLGQVTVMTWNIYVGANVDIVLQATGPIDLAIKVAAAYDTLQMTNFPERAVAIAKQIAKTKPHIIGLQEVSLIQRFSTYPPTPGSLTEQLDYLHILLNAIAAEGLNYRLADSVHNADVYVPMYAGGTPASPVLNTVRLLDADVILVRHDVDYGNSIKNNYAAALEIPDFGIKISRGYVSVEATVNQKAYRYVNTHLEAFTEFVRLLQARELTETFADASLPVIMAGDFNTLTSPLSDDATYQLLTSNLKDSWVHNLYGNQGDGFTSPNASDLMNPYPDLYQRIDLILVGNYGSSAGINEIGPVRAEVIGDELRDRTPSGLWPSDHAGVVAQLHLASPAL